MSKKILKVVLVFSSLVFFAMTEVCFAEWKPSRLNKARDYMKTKDYYRVETIYTSVLTDSPCTSNEFRARTNLVIMYIKLERYNEAQEILDKLIENFSERSALPGVLYRIAKRYATNGKYEKAKSIFELITQRYPNSSKAEGAQDHIRRVSVLSLIQSRNYTEAQQALDKLIEDYSRHRSLPKILFDIAREYQVSEKYEEANNIYQYILANYTDTEEASAAQGRLVDLYLEGYGQIPEAVDNLVAYFSQNENFPELLYNAAKKWEKLDKYDGAKTIYQQIIQHCPDSAHAYMAQIDIARLDIIKLIRLGEDKTTQTAIDKLIAFFSDDPYLTRTLFTIGEEYYNKAVEEKNKGNQQRAEEYHQNAVIVWEKIIHQELPAGLL